MTKTEVVQAGGRGVHGQRGASRKGKSPIISRYLRLANLNRMKEDFAFLLRFARSDPDLRGELGLELRDDYFNIYYRGNSLCRVDFLSDDGYRVTMNHQFAVGAPAWTDPRFTRTPAELPEKGDVRFTVPRNLVHALLSKQNLRAFARNIKHVNYSEELWFEQMVMTGNQTDPELIIIDRQVADRSEALAGRRMDLLALQRREGGDYRFVVVEVKLGCNPDLRKAGKKVHEQVKSYVDHIHDHFADYADSYAVTIQQKCDLGLVTCLTEPPILVNDPSGLLVVVGYAGLAVSNLEALQAEHPDFQIRMFNFHLPSAVDHFGPPSREKP